MNRSTSEELFVTTHVARDLLQAAGLFKNEKTVAWEYVVNSLQYVDPGAVPVVNVVLDGGGKKIHITDNGRGMSWSDLRNFFKMHGENLDRKEGRAGRGRFGTGKSAAFGIGDVLRVKTIRNGLRSTVELHREDLEKMKSGDPVPVRTIEKETPTDEKNGTRVDIERVHLKSFDVPGVVHFFERHLAHWRRDATVIVNDHLCEYSEPPVSKSYTFKPTGAELAKLGDVTLTVKVAKGPLDSADRGIAIYSKGVWHESTLAGAEGRDMSQYIFGDIDIPRLDDDQSPIKPFDMSRNMMLNASNALVQATYAFVGRHVEDVRRKLVEADRARRATEEAKKLAAEAEKIAAIINSDFYSFRDKLAKVKAKTSGSTDLYHDGETGPSGDALFPGGADTTATPSDVLGDFGTSETRDGVSGGEDPRELKPLLSPDEQGSDRAQSRAQQRKRPSQRGGFGVDFKNVGSSQARAVYNPDERMIYINLDHPQIAAAKGAASVEDPIFKRLAYEVAFAEYAIALAQELANRGEYLDVTDPIFDIRDTLNRVAVKAAHLYAA